MRLDPDLVRAILLRIEEAPPNGYPDQVELDGYDKDPILEHLELLTEAGLIEARVMKSGAGNARIMAVHVSRLTWSGHEFIDNARNDTQWRRARSLVAEKAGGVSLGVLKAVLVEAAKAALHIS
jgi:hypothetical protein